MPTSTLVSFSRAVQGTIRRRLLVNAVVDPEEAAWRLPPGLRPHVTGAGTVVGCCLLDIQRIRPAHLPALSGIPLRAAAHRISVEWDNEAGEPVAGVYVPVRHADSRLAVAPGGRWFPGAHRRARVDIRPAADRLTWHVDDARRTGGYGIRIAVRLRDDQTSTSACDSIATTCLDATVGPSPHRSGSLEAARMEPDHRTASTVVVEDLDSGFISGFTTATPAPAYLMEDVDVTWAPAPAPRLAPAERRA